MREAQKLLPPIRIDPEEVAVGGWFWVKCLQRMAKINLKYV